jgi:hypothetical protein
MMSGLMSERRSLPMDQLSLELGQPKAKKKLVKWYSGLETMMGMKRVWSCFS